MGIMDTYSLQRQSEFIRLLCCTICCRWVLKQTVTFMSTHVVLLPSLMLWNELYTQYNYSCRYIKV